MAPTAVEATAPTTAVGPAPAVDEAAWAAMQDKPVVLQRGEGEPVKGKLIAHEGTHAVVMQDDGKVASIAKADVTALEAPKPVEAPKPPAAPETPPPTKPKSDWKWHKLGLFTSHGAAYTRWRTPNYVSGAATYNLDAAVGFNFGPRFGVYALAGGAVGSKLNDKTVRGNYGRFALSFLVRRKYFAFIPGIGLALASRKGPDNLMVRETGVAIPMKLMGLIPIKAGKIEGMHITIGLTYDLAIMANTRPLNSIGLQVGVARF